MMMMHPRQCKHALGTKNGENNNLQVCLSNFVAFCCLFDAFLSPSSPDLMPAVDAAAAACYDDDNAALLHVMHTPQPTNAHRVLTVHMKDDIVYNTAHQNLTIFVFCAFTGGSMGLPR
jgi:hypothetical protein